MHREGVSVLRPARASQFQLLLMLHATTAQKAAAPDAVDACRPA